MTALNPPQAAARHGTARISESEPEPGPRPRPSPRSPGWRPWHGRPRARDLACALAIFVSAVYALAMIPLTPVLIATRPVLLEMLSGSNSAIVAAGAFSDVDSKLQLAVVVSAALPGMLRFDWVIWWAGRLWGHRIVEKLGAHSPRTAAAAVAAAAERRGTRFVAPAVLLSAFLPISGAPVYAAAGWVGLPLIPFMILDAIGCGAWAAVLGTAGYLLGPAGVTVADLISRYALATMGVLVLLAVAPHAWHAWRTRARCAALRAVAEAGLSERAEAAAAEVRILPEGAEG